MLASLAVLLVLSIGLQLINPQIIRYFIDTAQGEGSLTALYYAAGFLLAFTPAAGRIGCSRLFQREFGLDDHQQAACRAGGALLVAGHELP